MAESFITTNRFLTINIIRVVFLVMAISLSREAQILERHGQAFNELDLGKREPATEAEKLFVAMCRGEREAATVEEKNLEEIYQSYKSSKTFSYLYRVESHSSIHLMTIPILMINIISFNLKGGVFRSFFTYPSNCFVNESSVYPWRENSTLQ